jgi:hypothetical protein
MKCSGEMATSTIRKVRPALALFMASTDCVARIGQKNFQSLPAYGIHVPRQITERDAIHEHHD